MADIFISYSQEDPEPTHDIAAYLQSEGYSVWWDTNLTAGERFRDVIDRELDAAKAVIVIWTMDSITSNWVLAEADHADRDGKLIPLRTTDVDPRYIPKPYSTYHTAVVDDYAAILRAVRRLLGGEGLDAESNSEHDVLSVDDRIPAATYLAIRAALAEGRRRMHEIAADLGVGVGTVRRVKAEMAAVPWSPVRQTEPGAT